MTLAHTDIMGAIITTTLPLLNKPRTKRTANGINLSGAKGKHARRDKSIKFRRHECDNWDCSCITRSLKSKTALNHAATADEFGGMDDAREEMFLVRRSRFSDPIVYCTTPKAVYTPELSAVRNFNMRTAQVSEHHYDDAMNHRVGGVRRSKHRYV